MDFLETLRTRLQALLTERSAAQAELDGILATVETEARTELTAPEQTRFTELRDLLGTCDGNTGELTQRIEQIETTRAAAAAADALTARFPSLAAGGGGQIRSEPAVYEQRGAHSFFQDFCLRSINPAAAERLARNQREMETRVGTTANLAGLIPPQYLIDQFAPLLRSGRITSSLVTSLPLPPVGTSFNLGRATTGTAVDVQATENSALATADFDDTLLTFGLATIGGYTEMSRQELERSVSGDQIIMRDLASIYAFRLNFQVLNGSGAAGQLKGILNATGAIAVTYTDASPTVGELYPKLADAIQQINTQRLMPATAIVMHPRRWGWFVAAVDTVGRPLIPPTGNQLNSIGLGGAVGGVSPIPVGEILGLPVFTDPAMPTNFGIGTNEDRILIARFEDDLLMEDDSVVPYRVYEEPGSAVLTLRIVLAGYAAFTAERYAVANAIIQGTGLVSPVF